MGDASLIPASLVCQIDTHRLTPLPIHTYKHLLAPLRVPLTEMSFCICSKVLKLWHITCKQGRVGEDCWVMESMSQAKDTCPPPPHSPQWARRVQLSPPLPPCSVLPIQFPVLIGVICAPGNLPWVTSSKKRRCKQKVWIPIILYVLKTKEVDRIELSNVQVSNI